MSTRPAVAALAVTALFLVGCNPGESPGGDPAPQPGVEGEPPASERDDGSVTAKPGADVSGDCVSEPEPDGDNFALVAPLQVTNTGNLGTKVRVHVRWPQTGPTSIKTSRTVRVEQGETKDVRLALGITADEASRVTEAVDAGHACAVKHTVVGAFGSPSG